MIATAKMCVWLVSVQQRYVKQPTATTYSKCSGRVKRKRHVGALMLTCKVASPLSSTLRQT